MRWTYTILAAVILAGLVGNSRAGCPCIKAYDDAFGAPCCCEPRNHCCDHIWDGYCEHRARVEAFWCRVGTPRPKRPWCCRPLFCRPKIAVPAAECPESTPVADCPEPTPTAERPVAPMPPDPPKPPTPAPTTAGVKRLPKVAQSTPAKPPAEKK